VDPMEKHAQQVFPPENCFCFHTDLKNTIHQVPVLYQNGLQGPRNKLD
jgi:hypothetical protein